MTLMKREMCRPEYEVGVTCFKVFFEKDYGIFWEKLGQKGNRPNQNLLF
jgi:hypothetical protein